MSIRESLIDSVTGRQEIDTSSGRVIFDKVFDTTKDIYMSFVIPQIDVNILTEDVQKILTENSINIAAEYIDMTALRTGLVVFLIDVLPESNKKTDLNPLESARTYSSRSTNTPKSRLDSNYAWISENNVGTDQYVEMDLYELKTISGIVTQGRFDSDQWVTVYRVQYSTDGITWSWVDDQFPFTGNTDRSTKVRSNFSTNVEARYIRVYPYNWFGSRSMRVGVVETKAVNGQYYGESGPGLGMLSYDTLKDNVSGHIASVAFDVFGGYSLSGIYHDINTGYEALYAKTISSRVSSTVSEYQFLSSTTPTDDKVFDLNIDKKFLRFKFKDHLTTVALDYRNNIKDEYTNVFKADTNINPNTKPKNVRIGIASSGLIKLPIQDITYSGTLSS